MATASAITPRPVPAINDAVVLGKAHHYAKSEKLQFAVERLVVDVQQLASIFSELPSKSKKEKA
jgi:hypothetical protein